MTTPEPSPAPRRLALVAGALCLCWCTIAAYSASTVMADTAIELPGVHSPLVNSLAPQGWAFFTRDPREPQMHVLELRDEQWLPLPGFRVSSRENSFGTSRRARKLGVEYGMLFNAVTKDQWRDCKDDVSDCLDVIDETIELDTPSPAPAICGDIALVSQPAVPWAWARSAKPISMPSRIAKLRVTC